MLYSLVLFFIPLDYIFWVVCPRYIQSATKQNAKRADFSFKSLAKGDVGFSYSPATISRQKISMLFGGLLMILGLCLILVGQIESKWRALLFIIPILAFAFVYHTTNIVAINRKRETLGINTIFNCEKITEICSRLYSDTPTCQYFKYIIHKTEYFGSFQRLVAAYLSNGKTIVFRVNKRKNELGKWSFTIIMKPEETRDKDVIKKVLPLSVRIGRVLNPDNNAVAALMAYLLLWIVLAIVLIGPFFLNAWFWILALGCYSFIGYLLALIQEPQKYPRWFVRIIVLPGRLYNLLINLTVPILLFLLGIIILSVTAVLIAASVYGLSWVIVGDTIGLNFNYAVFLCVISFSLTSVYANGFIQKIFGNIDVFKNFTDKSMDSPMLGLLEYVFQKENINCILYSVYLLYIASSTFCMYLSNSDGYLVSPDIDNAVIKAFLIHIAFTNMVARRREMKISTKGFLDYVTKVLEQK